VLLQSLIVKGFRSIAESKLPLSSGVTILVGRNSTGKSNILRALRLATQVPTTLQPKLQDEDFSPGISRIEIKLQLIISDEERKNLADPVNKAKVQISRPLVDFSRATYSDLLYTVDIAKGDSRIRYYLGYRKVSKLYPLFAKGASSSLNLDILHIFQSMLAKVYLPIQCQDCFDRIPETDQHAIAHILMRQYLNSDPTIRSRYNEVRDGLWFITEGIGGEIQPAQLPRDKSKGLAATYILRSEIEKTHFVPLPYMGEGAKRVALVLYHIVNSPYAIIGIEEPETNLHPGAQRRFRNMLDSLSTKYGKKLVLTTHSTLFVDGWQSASIHKVDIVKGMTSLSPPLERDHLMDVARILGVTPGDALASDGIIWVEGPSDRSVYTIFFKTLGTDLEANNISLMWVGGDALQHVSVSGLRQLNPNFVVLIDSERTSPSGKIPKWKRQLADDFEHNGYMFFITQRRSIENYFTLSAISRYYKAPSLPAPGNYDDLQIHIQKNLQGNRTYSKMRDSAPIASLMSAAEVESLGDLTIALRRVQQLISDWKQLK